MAFKVFRPFITWHLPAFDSIKWHSPPHSPCPATLAVLFWCFNMLSFFLPQRFCICCYFCLWCSSLCHWLVSLNHSDLISNITSLERPAHLYVVLHTPLLQPFKVTIITLMLATITIWNSYLFTFPLSHLEWKLHEKRDFICLVHYITLLLKIVPGI